MIAVKELAEIVTGVDDMSTLPPRAEAKCIIQIIQPAREPSGITYPVTGDAGKSGVTRQ